MNRTEPFSGCSRARRSSSGTASPKSLARTSASPSAISMAASPGVSARADRTAVTASRAATLRLCDLPRESDAAPRTAAASPAGRPIRSPGHSPRESSNRDPRVISNGRAAARAVAKLAVQKQALRTACPRTQRVCVAALAFRLLGRPLGLPCALVQVRDGFMHAADRGPAGEHAAVNRECRGELAGCHSDLSDNELEHGRFGRLLLQPRECLFRDALVTARQPEPRLGALSVERRERAVMRGGGHGSLSSASSHPREHLARLRVHRHCSDGLAAEARPPPASVRGRAARHRGTAPLAQATGRQLRRLLERLDQAASARPAMYRAMPRFNRSPGSVGRAATELLVDRGGLRRSAGPPSRQRRPADCAPSAISLLRPPPRAPASERQHTHEDPHIGVHRSITASDAPSEPHRRRSRPEKALPRPRGGSALTSPGARQRDRSRKTRRSGGARSSRAAQGPRRSRADHARAGSLLCCH